MSDQHDPNACITLGEMYEIIGYISATIHYDYKDHMPEAGDWPQLIDKAMKDMQTKPFSIPVEKISYGTQS